MKPPGIPESDLSSPKPDALSLAYLAARLMATEWFRKKDLARTPGRYDLTTATGRDPWFAVKEANLLFTECAQAIGLSADQGGLRTRKQLHFEIILSDGNELDPAGMSLALASVAIQILAAGAPRMAVVKEALGLLMSSKIELSMFPAEKKARIPTPSTWPANLREFYVLIMRVRDKLEAQPRFRRYLLSGMHQTNRWSQVSKEAPDEIFERLKSKGFEQDDWVLHAHGYRNWWQIEFRAMRRQAGLAGYVAKLRGGAKAKRKTG